MRACVRAGARRRGCDACRYHDERTCMAMPGMGGFVGVWEWMCGLPLDSWSFDRIRRQKDPVTHEEFVGDDKVVRDERMASRKRASRRDGRRGTSVRSVCSSTERSQNSLLLVVADRGIEGSGRSLG